MKTTDVMNIKKLVPWLKLGVGVFLMGLIWRELDLNLLRQVGSRWDDFLLYVVAGAALFVAAFCLTILRWNLLLHAFEVPHHVSDAFRIGWIGVLASQLIPGATGGDAVKGYYVAAESPSRRTEAVLSVVLDRVIGLVGLMLLGGLVFTLQWTSVQENVLLRRLFWVLAAAVLALFGSILLAFWDPFWRHPWLRTVYAKLPGKRFLDVLGRALARVRRKPKMLAAALGFSLLVHVLMILTHVLMARGLEGEFPDIGAFFLLIPVGLLANALPLSPGGLGVGEAAYHQLFRGSGLEHGAELAILMRVTTLALSTVGLYYYVRGRKELEQAVRVTREPTVQALD